MDSGMRLTADLVRAALAEIRRLEELEDENRKLKQLVADLMLDKTMLRDVLRRKS